MREEEGIVVETEGGIAKVSILAKSACEKCASAGVCHPAGEDSYMEAVNPLGAKKGQRVKVVVAPQVFLKASIILYGIPKAVFVAAAIIGKNIGERGIPAKRIRISGPFSPAWSSRWYLFSSSTAIMRKLRRPRSTNR